VSVAPPAAYAVARRSHRDTALRTPMGWQTASLPGRRRSWLIAGGVVGALSVVTAAVLTLIGDGEPREPREPSSHAHAVSPDSTAAAPAAVTPRPVASGDFGPASEAAPPRRVPGEAPEAREARAAVPPAAPAPAEPSVPAAPARDPRGDVRRPPVAPRPRDRSPGAVSRPGRDAAPPDTAPRRSRDRAAEVREPDAAPSGRPAADQEATTARPEEPRTTERSETAASGSAAISTGELGALYHAVQTEIEQQPASSQQDLLNQLAMLNILRALTESQQAREDAAAQLQKLRQRMHDRKSGR
jgi:hypothetical protein